MAQRVQVDPAYVLGQSKAEAHQQGAPLPATLIATALIALVVLVCAARAAESTGPASMAPPALMPVAAIDLPDGIVVGDHYVVPYLPPGVVDHLPSAEAQGDQYLSQRIELADLIIGGHILAAENLATLYARDLPGFRAVLIADGFRQEQNGAWFYDRFESWMRFPLNR